MSREQFDADQAERVRRIQEEIRRKIAERRGQATPPPMPPPTPTPSAPPRLPQRPVYGEEPPLPPTWQPAPPTVQPPRLPQREVSTYDDTAALERQRRLEEQMAELETKRREIRRAAQALAETGAAPEPVHGASRAVVVPLGSAPRSLAAELRDPKALRRAIVMREVLDAPVALR